MNARRILVFIAETVLALSATWVTARAQSSDLLPIEVKCPAEGSQTYAQVFRRFDGLTIRYLIKYDGDKAIAVVAEVATSDSVFRILDEIDLLNPEADKEKKALAELLITKNQPAFDAVCRGPSAEKDRYEQQLRDNAQQLGRRP
jgi:hypothetical protein